MDHRLNIKRKTLELLKNNKGENPDDLGYGGAFLDAIPKTRYMKEIIDKPDFTKNKNFWW